MYELMNNWGINQTWPTLKKSNIIRISLNVFVYGLESDVYGLERDVYGLERESFYR